MQLSIHDTYLDFLEHSKEKDRRNDFTFLSRQPHSALVIAHDDCFSYFLLQGKTQSVSRDSMWDSFKSYVDFTTKDEKQKQDIYQSLDKEGFTSQWFYIYIRKMVLVLLNMVDEDITKQQLDQESDGKYYRHFTLPAQQDQKEQHDKYLEVAVRFLFDVAVHYEKEGSPIEDVNFDLDKVFGVLISQDDPDINQSQDISFYIGSLDVVDTSVSTDVAQLNDGIDLN